MRKTRPRLRTLLLVFLAMQGASGFPQVQPSSDQNLFPGVAATAGTTALPGFTASVTDAVLPGITVEPIGLKSLAGPPSVIALSHLEPAQMSDADRQVVATLRADVARQAARANFDISGAAWDFQQILCPPLPGYVFLAFYHGPDTEGSSRFVAILPRDRAHVRIASTYAHGLLPFDPSWNRPGSSEILNEMLRRERGHTPLSYAANWLAIGMCYAELTGYPVQVLTTQPNPKGTLDLLRLDADRPQLFVDSDQSASVTFSDVSRPDITVNWNLHFDRKGEITSVSRKLTRQAPSIALKP